MNRRRNSLFSLLLCVAATYAPAQLNLPIQSMNGQQYYYYKVKSKETIYGVAHKLKISQEDIVKYNPTAASGLKDKQMLFFPVADFSKAKTTEIPETVVVPDNTEFSHIVEPGETLFGLSKTYGMSIDEIVALNPELNGGTLKSGMTIRLKQPNEDTIFITIESGSTLFSTAKKYNTTVEQIMSDNPGITPSNFKAGEVIRITPNSAKPVTTQREVTKYYPYEVQKGDTFESVASAHDMTVDELKSANPEVDKLKKGSFIYIPKTQTETVQVSPFADADSSQLKMQEIYHDVHIAKEPNSINIALMLPFMLNNTDATQKQARLFTEFYKGFLLAVNDLRFSTSKHINIFAYDTENSLSVTRNLLNKEEMKNMDMIFAPDNSEQISLIAEFGKNNDVNIINTFSTKNEEYMNNSRVFHLNVPNVYMNLKVIDWIDSQFKGYDVVFLNNGENDSKEIVAQMKSSLKSGHGLHDYGYASELNSEELSATLKEGGKYLFIPNSSSKRDLLRIAPVLASIKENRQDIEIALFGYPEWSTYLNSCEANLKKIDTYFYSRFFVIDSDSSTRQLCNNFNRWYGEDMIYAAPQFGMLGYDTGYFFLKSYIDENFTFGNSGGFTGVQTDFRLERTSNWSGFVNKAMYIVHLSPYGSISRTLK